jgi:two-component system, NtrC family, nitrogen regulation sensor histidine kinase NtrY
MSLRAKIITYLVVIHLIWAGMAVFVFFDNRVWLLLLELFFVLSVVLGVLLVRAFFVPLDLIRTGAELMNERDFSCKFLETGQTEMDQLVRVYNQMIEALREERLKATEQDHFLHEVITASPSGIVILDYDRRISHVSPSAERLLQHRADETLGKQLLELGEPFGRHLAELPIGQSSVFSFHGNRRLKCHKSQFFDRGFGRQFVLLEELTEELRQSEKRAYEKLIRMMSHEVNNSVAAISSLLESSENYAAQVSEADRVDFTTALKVARERAQHLNGFMRRFADVVRLPLPELRPCDLRRLFEDLGSLFSAEFRRRRVCLEWDVDPEMTPVPIDKNQMEQVFVNILKNSLEAIGEDGRITIRLGRNGLGPFVAIEDSGPGIPENVRQNLFTPFFSTKPDGQGIGLTLIQEILLHHGFRFSLESPAGGPTRFSIWMKRPDTPSLPIRPTNAAKIDQKP